jgi:deoxyribose-phosphate aldolase
MSAIAPYIDYTLLTPGITQAEIEALCKKARVLGYAAACVSPYFLPSAASYLAGSSVKPCTVIGFPHGLHHPDSKLAETRLMVEYGAKELDMVINLSALRSGDWDTLRIEVAGFQELCAAWRVTSKVIIESGLLDRDEIQKICDLCVAEAVNFVKTSTGFAAVGAELDKVAFLRDILPPQIQIKASGGIRNYSTALAFLEAGASRIGTSTLIVDP